MNVLRPLALLFILMCVPTAARRADEDPYVRLAKAIEAFGAVFRDVQVRYVDPVDPVELVEVGIDAMLEHLDPYSEFFVGSETDEVDMLSTGTYTGVGIVVDEIDSALIITDLRNEGSAKEAAIRIGDRIVRVDSVWADSLDQDGLRTFTRGTAGTKLSMWLVRDGKADTMKVTLERRSLTLESVYTADRLPNSIGYVKLSRFTGTSRDELFRAISQLQGTVPLKGLIIDLRDNPGGLLEAAIEVTELFVPQGSTIVSTRGRSDDESRTYASMRPPTFPTLPLAVLVNQNSASASEVVSGALQDLDRAVIIGKRSYGKGFVQSMIPVADGNSALKLTTARYYTPSGRCIQRVDARNSTSDSKTAFQTMAGRAVSARHGIDPDTVVSDSTLPRLLYNLQESGAIGSFATRHAAKFNAPPQAFATGRGTLDEFYRYLESLPAKKRDPLFSALENLRKSLAEVEGSPQLRSALQALQTQVEKDYYVQLHQHDKKLRDLITNEVDLRFSTGSAQYRRNLLDIPSVRTALDVLLSPKYGAFLAPKLPSDQ